MNRMKVICTGGSGFIGTHLIDGFLAKGIEVINVDIKKSHKQVGKAYWRECNILDLDGLEKVFKEFQPTHVVHLAARATMDGTSLDDFRENTVGTANILTVVKKTASISRLIITSTQHVRKPGSGLPQHEEDFAPLGLYGQSKVITEQLTRKADLPCVWTIVRPTTIWGPFHPFLPDGLWKYMKKRYYMHPNNDTVIRAYGYVKNTAWQILQLLFAPSEAIHRRVFYLGDSLMYQKDWIDAFSSALCGCPARKVPKEILYAMAKIGDGLSRFDIKFPMYEERYRNLTTPNPVPLEPVMTLLGNPPIDFEMAVAETVDWLEKYWTPDNSK